MNTDRTIRVIAHNVRSLWNVGSIFRTCDGFNVEKLYLTGYTGAPPRKEISKVALGAEEWVEWEQFEDPADAIAQLQKDGFIITALEQTRRSDNVADYRAPEKVCLVLGHEVDGIDRDLLKLCEEAIEIPMLGNKESFNVAVAAGIALYALRNL